MIVLNTKILVTNHVMRGRLHSVGVQLTPFKRPPIQTRKINFHAIAERTNFTSVETRHHPIRRLVIPSSLRSHANMRQRCRRINQLCDEADAIINGIEEMIFRTNNDVLFDDSPIVYADPTPSVAPKEVPKDAVKDKEFSETDGFTECPICLNQFEQGETVGRLSCGHLFHRDCVACWICDHPSCPVCRKQLF